MILHAVIVECSCQFFSEALPATIPSETDLSKKPKKRCQLRLLAPVPRHLLQGDSTTPLSNETRKEVCVFEFYSH